MYGHKTIKVHVHCTVHLDGAVNLQINITNDLIYSYILLSQSKPKSCVHVHLPWMTLIRAQCSVSLALGSSTVPYSVLMKKMFCSETFITRTPLGHSLVSA